MAAAGNRIDGQDDAAANHHEPWRQFVTTRFDKMTREYSNILVMAENI